MAKIDEIPNESAGAEAPVTLLTHDMACRIAEQYLARQRLQAETGKTASTMIEQPTPYAIETRDKL